MLQRGWSAYETRLVLKADVVQTTCFCVQATEKELEHYKGREDRETRLQEEKEELLTSNKALEETLASKENV